MGKQTSTQGHDMPKDIFYPGPQAAMARFLSSYRVIELLLRKGFRYGQFYRGAKRGTQNRYPIFSALAVSNRQCALAKVEIFNP